MQRRDVLKSATTALTVGAAGLAGCSGSEETATLTPEPLGETTECRPPAGSLAATLPAVEAFDRQGGITASDASHDSGVERTAYALYQGPDNGEYYCSISEYTSAEAASDGTYRTRLEGGHSNVVLGLVQFDQYVYFAAGPDRGGVRELLGATSLSGACLDEAFRTLSETATPKPL